MQELYSGADTNPQENNYAKIARAQESAELNLLLEVPSMSSFKIIKVFANLGLEVAIEPVVQASRNLESHHVMNAISFLHDLKQEHTQMIHGYVGENDAQGRVVWANKVTVSKVETDEEVYPEVDLSF